MRENDGSFAAEQVSRGRENPDNDESLRFETQAAAGAVAAHLRKLAGTATTEAKLSVASITAMVIAGVVSLLLLVAAWLCVVAAGVSVAVSAGLSVATALLIAAGIHIVVVLVLLLWGRSLFRNVGFSRTRKLVFPE